MVISFTPQLLVLNFGLLLSLSWLNFASSFGLEAWLLFLVCLALFASSTIPVLGFSFGKPAVSGNARASLRVAAFNKLLTNDDTTQIYSRINSLEPDIVGLVEVKQTDFNQLNRSLRLPYQYMSQHKYGLGSKSEFSLFSKHPISQVYIHSLDRYGAVLQAELKISQKHLSVFIVHATVPLAPKLLKERDSGLRKLAKKLNRKTGRVLVMGDFNLTPWSRTYQRFSNSAKKYYNPAQGSGLKFTWRFIWPFAAQIDHIFATRNIKTKRFAVDQYLGSDHKLIYADLEF